MVQRLILEVESPKPIQEYGDGHVLLYNKASGKYYVTTRESLFAVQDAKISSLENKLKIFMDDEKKKFDDFKNNVQVQNSNLKQKFEDYQEKIDTSLDKFEEKETIFKNEMLEKERNFLLNYQENNAVIIDMVKKLVI